ncbi:MAG TPA: potassium transporter TrkG [Gaiellaceae bacterium]|nr:potassium transporter TrkG [Gaiellaceae bacterium]
MRGFLRRRHPAQLIVFAFAVGILVGALLLLAPFATAGPGRAPFTTALFTSTSALCVTGLVVVDTPTYWTHYGQVVILALIQVGGIGIMTLASLLALLVARRLGLRSRLVAQAETAAAGLQDVRRLVVGVVLLSLLFEALAAIVLTVRFWLSYDLAVGSALYRGIFHAISAFNNAGFTLWSDNLAQFVTDGWISVTIALAIVAGGLGFPVWLELRRRVRAPRSWTLHTKLTLAGTFFLIVFGFVAVLVFEWSNARTTGELGVGGKLLASFFQGVTPRTAGFNTLDYASLEPETLLVTDILMFVGAGSVSTGGGIKVTTFVLLFLMVWTEVRGDPNVTAFDRRVSGHAQRQALAVTFIALNAVVLATLALMAESGLGFQETLFEAISAFGTVGLSTGITADFGEVGRLTLVALMFLGRTGPYTLAVALALRERRRLYRFPEERPIIG